MLENLIDKIQKTILSIVKSNLSDQEKEEKIKEQVNNLAWMIKLKTHDEDRED